MAFSVLCFGDSLTAGYGVAPKDSWVSLLTRRFPSTRFYNHGICGCLFPLSLRMLCPPRRLLQRIR